MTTILVPLDGSPFAERALPYVQALAPVLQARVELVCSLAMYVDAPALVEPATASSDERPWFQHEAAHERLTWAEQYHYADTYLARHAAALRRAGLTVSTVVRDGPPAENIIEVAREQQPALIVMATHGYSGLKRWMIGSVADAVMRVAPCPVLLLRGEVDRPKFKRILVPFDGSSLGQQAVPLALDIATRARARLFLLQAVNPPVELNDIAYGVRASDTMKLFRMAQDQLDALSNTLQPAGVPITTIASIGSPAEEIAATADNQQIDLIVMATHGYGGLKRWMIGSVADAALQATTTPLLLVRPAEQT